MNAPRTGIEGSLLIRVAPAHGRVSIESSRPLLASRLFEGKTIDETLALIPLLFNVCGQAQQTAAVRAIESARGDHADDDVEQARDALVDVETLREHLWRILMDWPRFTGHGPASARLPDVMGTIEAIRRAVDPDRTLCSPTAIPCRSTDATLAQRCRHLRECVRSDILDTDPADWLSYDVETLQHWLSTSNGVAGRLLRKICKQGWHELGKTSMAYLNPLPATELARRLDDAQTESFIAAPTWNGLALETGPLARQSGHPLMTAAATLAGNGLLTRLLARLVEVALIVTRHPIAGTATETDEPVPGLAQVEAARGRLCHRIALDGGRVSRYRILAPTEWNFAPDSAAVQALRTIQAVDITEIRAQADLLVHAIDPCVGYNLEVESG